MRIAVFGTGGVGGCFGGRLAHAGEDVTFIARGPHLRALQEAGVGVEMLFLVTQWNLVLRIDTVGVSGSSPLVPSRSTVPQHDSGPVFLRVKSERLELQFLG